MKKINFTAFFYFIFGFSYPIIPWTIYKSPDTKYIIGSIIIALGAIAIMIKDNKETK